MQPFLGITPARSLGASDVPTSDARPASDPANGNAFRSALSSAHQRSSGAERAERSSNRTNEATPADDTAVTADDDAEAEAALSADALALLLTWLTPEPSAPTPTAPVVTAPTSNGDAPVTMAPHGTVTLAALGASASSLSALPKETVTPPTVDDTAGVAADTTTAATTTTTAPVSAFAVSQIDATLAGAIPLATDGITLPAGMTTTPDGAPGTPPAPVATTVASTEVPEQDLLATVQALTETRTAGASAAGSTTVATGEGAAAQAATPSTPTTWAGLAADFGAQVVATTSPAATRSTGTGASPIGQTALVDEAQIPTTGSTAQAAGAATTAGIQLPGQAVAATGASSQATTGTFAEALEAGPDVVSATPASQNGAEAPTELPTGIGATGTASLSQSQDVDAVQTSATTAAPIATQIADGALMAARRIGQSVEMILQPEGLGAVSLRVSVERGGLGVHIAVDNPQAREMVQASWPQLQQALEQRGLTVQSLLLDLSNGRGGEAFQQFSGQQQFNGQQARVGSASADRRGGPALATSDESPRVQTTAGTSARVDYRI